MKRSNYNHILRLMKNNQRDHYIFVRMSKQKTINFHSTIKIYTSKRNNHIKLLQSLSTRQYKSNKIIMIRKTVGGVEVGGFTGLPRAFESLVDWLCISLASLDALYQHSSQRSLSEAASLIYLPK